MKMAIGGSFGMERKELATDRVMFIAQDGQEKYDLKGDIERIDTTLIHIQRKQ